MATLPAPPPVATPRRRTRSSCKKLRVASSARFSFSTASSRVLSSSCAAAAAAAAAVLAVPGLDPSPLAAPLFGRPPGLAAPAFSALAAPFLGASCGGKRGHRGEGEQRR